jgi:hypothetical protein
MCEVCRPKVCKDADLNFTTAYVLGTTQEPAKNRLCEIFGVVAGLKRQGFSITLV